MANEVLTTGDARRMILQTIVELRSGSMDVSRGMAIAANMKVLNDSIFAEVAAAKMALLAKSEAHNFGRVVQMGQCVIGSSAESAPSPAESTGPSH